MMIMNLCVLLFMSCLVYQSKLFIGMNGEVIFNAVLVRSQDADVCHLYGDPHLIPFSQVSQSNQNGYWCKLSGEQQIVRNNFVDIKVNMREGEWSIDKVSRRMTIKSDNYRTLCLVHNYVFQQ